MYMSTMDVTKAAYFEYLAEAVKDLGNDKDVKAIAQ